MNIHEYQAKAVLAKYGVNVPFGVVAFNPEQVDRALSDLGETNVYVVKAQIHAGGRGKAGGVKVFKSKEDAAQFAKSLFGVNLITHQTGPEGQVIGRVYVEQGSNIDKELYLSLVVDRDTSKITFVASKEGGVEIEEVATHNPEKIIKICIDPVTGIKPFHSRKLAEGLGIAKVMTKDFTSFVCALYKAFVEIDASQLEINPLVVTKEAKIIALDAKVNFDDNALYRHQEIEEMRDLSEEDPAEIRAARFGLSYVKMDGEIGCMVNGAGLAMATMDIIKLHGSEPANFLDVGGGATKEKVTEAFKIILSDKNVKAILVNIFGGIMRCDIIADGIIAAAKDVDLKVPLVVRLAGTNFELGKQILENSGLKILSADDLGDAARQVVAEVKKL
jgi:succinyl-CoA synthetase beta subunit